MSTQNSTELKAGTAYRRDGLWIAALVHRLSGIGLAIFLPMHFLALGLAIEGAGALDGFLEWTQNPIVKLAEIGLFVLLTLHLLGGIRVLLIENMKWQPGQKSMAMAAIVMAAFTGLLFAFNLF